MDNLQKLIDIEEIKNLKHRYFRAIDMADFDLLDNVFAPDITIDYRGGTYRWESEGKDTIKESLKHAFHNQTAAMHTAHHPEIEIFSETEADGKWYLQDIFYNFDLGSVTQLCCDGCRNLSFLRRTKTKEEKRFSLRSGGVRSARPHRKSFDYFCNS